MTNGHEQIGHPIDIAPGDEHLEEAASASACTAI